MAPRWGRLALALVSVTALHLLLALSVELGNDARMQWAQVVTGRLNDWHPPAMTRLWQGLGVFGPGAAPMIVFSVLLYWVAVGTMATAFLRLRKPLLAWGSLGAALICAAVWFDAVSKDSLLTGFFVLGYGLIFHARLGPRCHPGLVAAGLVAVLLGVLMRHNGAFAAGPAVILALAPALLQRFWTAAGLSIAVAAVLAFGGQAANRAVFDAAPSRVEDSLLLFDLTGIAYHSGDAGVFGARSRITKRDVALCYAPVMWDTLAPWGRCPWFPEKAGGKIVDQPELIAGAIPPPSDFKARWLSATLRHPLAYITHRLRHTNAELLLFVSTKPRNGIVPVEPGGPGEARDSLPKALAKHTLGVVFIPAVMVALGVVAFVLLFLRTRHRQPGPLLLTAYAMSGSGLLYAAAYGVIGVATAPRYYMLTALFAMIALAVSCEDPAIRRMLRVRRWLRATCIALPLAMIGLAELGRLTVPVAPSTPVISPR